MRSREEVKEEQRNNKREQKKIREEKEAQTGTKKQ